MMQGVGHFPMLELPEQFNGTLEKVVLEATIPPRSP